MKDLTKIYLDLSKCTEEERKSLPSILERVGEHIYEETLYDLWNSRLDDEYIYLALYFNGDWLRFNSECLRSNGNLNRTELTYPEFIKLFEGGEGEKEVSFETEYQLEEFRKIQSEYFDENGKCYTGIHLSTNIMEQMLSLINQLETELNSK